MCRKAQLLSTMLAKGLLGFVLMDILLFVSVGSLQYKNEEYVLISGLEVHAEYMKKQNIDKLPIFVAKLNR